MILGSGRRLCLNSATHPETLQNKSAIGSFIGFCLDTGTACDSGLLHAVPCLMILICVFLAVPIIVDLDHFSGKRISLSCTYRISCLNIPEVFKLLGFGPQDKGTRQIDLVVRNNGADQKVYRSEGLTQELPYEDRKVAVDYGLQRAQ